jgi:RNA polymerase sigma-70 factor (ECF subfamily)
MAENEWLADRFQANRTHLRAVAYRMLGSATEADDAVQETWLRLSRSDASVVENLSAWLTTVVARVCLDMLRSRKSRREDAIDEQPEPAATREDGIDPEHEAVLADSVGSALVIVLETLAPAERVAFVLHDMFDLSFDEIAPIVNRTPEAARQLASRARRRIQGAATASDTARTRKREVVSAFLAASRGGDFDALLAVLDPDVVCRADSFAARGGFSAETRGSHAVAESFKERARGAQLALLDGVVGAVWAPEGQPRAAFNFTVDDGRIVRIDLLADPERIRQLEVVILGRAE